MRSARAQLQWSQSDLAQRAGVGVSTIADFEKGLRTPIANNLDAIRRAMEAGGVQFTQAGASVFNEASLHLMSATNAADLQFRYKAEAVPLVRQIVGVFRSGDDDGDGRGVSLDVVQTASPALKAALGALVDQHASVVPQLHRLRKFVTVLADDEHFLVLPEPPKTTAERLELERFLHRRNAPDGDGGAADDLEPLFGLLLQRYDMSTPRTGRPTMVGSRDAGARRCRFCSRTKAGGATFGKAAHVIPTALGNDYLKSADECDECNEYFGNETEPSLIAMLDVQRAFLGTQGRGKNDGRPDLRFGSGRMSHDGRGLRIEGRAVPSDDDAIVVDLGASTRAITPSAVYRALVKIVLSVVGADELHHLRRTVEWVRHGTGADQRLPDVAASVINLPPDPSAQITVYRRLDPHPRLPHLVGEFRLGCYVYVFAVPFSDLDGWDLVGFFAEPDFRDTFRHYAAVSNWVHQDLSGRTPGRMTPRLRFVRRT